MQLNSKFEYAALEDYLPQQAKEVWHEYEQQGAEPPPMPILLTCTLPTKWTPRILHELELMGITEATMFNDPDGWARLAVSRASRPWSAGLPRA